MVATSDMLRNFVFWIRFPMVVFLRFGNFQSRLSAYIVKVEVGNPFVNFNRYVLVSDLGCTCISMIEDDRDTARPFTAEANLKQMKPMALF